MNVDRIALITLSVIAVGFGVIQSSQSKSPALPEYMVAPVASMGGDPKSSPAGNHTGVWIVNTTEQTVIFCGATLGNNAVSCDTRGSFK